MFSSQQLWPNYNVWKAGPTVNQNLTPYKLKFKKLIKKLKISSKIKQNLSL